MDSPGLNSTAMSHQELCAMHPGPHAILLVIRLDDFNKQKEFGCYSRLKALFDDHITNFMIVVFTGGDELEWKNQTLADFTKYAPKELITILHECGNRSIVFNNFAHDPVAEVELLFDLVREMKEQNGHPYMCPKYMMIGDGLKEEVAKRLAVVEELEKRRERDTERNAEVIEIGVAEERQTESKQMLEEQDEEKRRSDQYEEVLTITKDRIAENKERDFTGRLIQIVVKPVKAFLKVFAYSGSTTVRLSQEDEGTELKSLPVSEVQEDWERSGGGSRQEAGGGGGAGDAEESQGHGNETHGNRKGPEPDEQENCGREIREQPNTILFFN